VLHELAEGDVENVAHTLEQIAEAEPGDRTVFLALAALDRRRGRVERAKAIHRTVLAAAELAPELRVAGFVGLGRDLLAQGHHEAAVGALSRAISLAPQSVATLESLARALEQAGAWDRAAAAWERHEKLVPARRRRDSRIGRGHAVAGQALAALGRGRRRQGGAVDRTRPRARARQRPRVDDEGPRRRRGGHGRGGAGLAKGVGAHAGGRDSR
jgi:predicted Zn-dependent protease